MGQMLFIYFYCYQSHWKALLLVLTELDYIQDEKKEEKRN